MGEFSLEALEPRTLFTAALTPTLVKDITPGSSSSWITNVTAVGSGVFFANEFTDDLWKSDGTAAGTVKLKEGDVFGDFYHVGNLHAAGNKLFFTARVDSADGVFLWVSDGTTGGTRAIKKLSDASGGIYDVRGIDLNGTFVFAAQNLNDAWVLWRSNGTAAGTRVVKVITTDPHATEPQNFVRAGNRVYFTAESGAVGNELWTSNGNAVGTYLLKDINPGNRDALPFFDGHADYGVVGGLLYFVAENANGYDWLWSTNGARAGTRARMQLGLITSHLTAVGNQLYYFTSGDLFRTLGTPATRVKVADIGESNVPGDKLPVLNNRLFFAGMNAVEFEPWVSGGTAATTFRIANVSPSGSSTPSDFHRVGNHVMFIADNGVHGDEIYVTQGTGASTRRLREIRTGKSTAWIDEITVAGNRAFFTADNGVNGDELWMFSTVATASAPAAQAAAPAPAAAVAAAALRDRARATDDREEEREPWADGFDLLAEPAPIAGWRA